MNRSKTLLILVFAVIAAVAVSAHDTWLTPRQFRVVTGTRVRLDLTSGMAFPHLDTSIKPDRIDVARFRQNGKIQEITARVGEPTSLVLSAIFKDTGIATCWVELKPRQLELTPTQVEEYFAEIGASPDVRQVWQNMKSPKHWREVYVKHAKTFITVGNNETDSSWNETVGMSLEIVPDKNPFTLRAGDDLPVRVLKNGVGFANFPVGIVFEGETHGQIRSTDANGRVVFRLAKQGRYLLRGTDLRLSTKPNLEWESDFTTLTFSTS
jgi:uncharacterized GH25 family protein